VSQKKKNRIIPKISGNATELVRGKTLWIKAKTKKNKRTMLSSDSAAAKSARRH
jgi:hypothetical protein